MTALGQHSMVPPLYANRAKVALRARTAREAPSMCKSAKPLDEMWRKHNP